VVASAVVPPQRAHSSVRWLMTKPRAWSDACSRADSELANVKRG